MGAGEDTKENGRRMRNNVQVRVSPKFKENLEKLYPEERSFVKKSRKLNEKLEELLYGIKKER